MKKFVSPIGELKIEDNKSGMKLARMQIGYNINILQLLAGMSISDKRKITKSEIQKEILLGAVQQLNQMKFYNKLKLAVKVFFEMLKRNEKM